MVYRKKLIEAGGSAGVALRQSFEQRPGLLQIRGVEPFGENSD